MDISPARSMKARLRADLKAAMLARRTGEVATMRSLIAAIDNAEAPSLEGGRTVQLDQPDSSEVDRLELGSAELEVILAAQVTEREQAIQALKSQGDHQRMQDLLAQIELIQRYLG